MGKDVHYLDDHLNRSIMQKLSTSCYMPMSELLLKLIAKHEGKLKVSFSISGIAIEQMKQYAPEALERLKELAATGCVEFIAETYSHSLTSITNPEEFKLQVERQVNLIKKEFGYTPTTFRGTELIYSDAIGEMVADMGFTAMATEGARHILGWKSPNYIYTNAINPRLKLLLRNFSLSDDLRYRFSDRTWNEWPLTVEKYTEWLNSEENKGDVVNIFLDYETFGEHQCSESGIFEFMEYLPEYALKHDIKFETPKEIVAENQPIAVLHVPYPISWTDEERDVTAWFGNELQNEAITKLYALRDKVLAINDEDLNKVWDFLQSSNHFYYMSTKWFSDRATSNVNPYDSPYEAFINYMNVLSDFSRQVDEQYAQLQS